MSRTQPATVNVVDAECGCRYEIGSVLNRPAYTILRCCDEARPLRSWREVCVHLGLARAGRTPQDRASEPPGRVVTENGHHFHQHWLPGMRGRIYRDVHHPKRVGREVVAIGWAGNNEFGPFVEIDGERTFYWWGQVEVLEDTPCA
jgi:hypothetical protein